MRYMLLLYRAPNVGPQPTDADFGDHMQSWFTYTNDLEKAGALVAGDALEGVETATTVNVHDGKTVSTDGPFAETKEVLTGYYMIDVADLDAATEWAAKVPSAPYGSVEIRPIMEIPS